MEPIEYYNLYNELNNLVGQDKMTNENMQELLYMAGIWLVEDKELGKEVWTEGTYKMIMKSPMNGICKCNKCKCKTNLN